ncbi:MAG: RHS repeat-associated core domain-containing protein [Bacteroidales bacterium]
MKCTESNTVLQPNRFCGKEELTMHGYDMYDSKARFLTSKCLRFTSLDPLVEKYYSISPYAYAANNPINMIDPDGRDVYRYDDKMGEMILHKKTTTSLIK